MLCCRSELSAATLLGAKLEKGGLEETQKLPVAAAHPNVGALASALS